MPTSSPTTKESVNFAFPFHVPGGEVRLDVPLGVMRVEHDQMPSACKNWLTVGRWADIANGEFGVTWVTLDAPLVQVGGITATLLNSQTNPNVWRKQIEPTQKLYSWARMVWPDWAGGDLFADLSRFDRIELSEINGLASTRQNRAAGNSLFDGRIQAGRRSN